MIVFLGMGMPGKGWGWGRRRDRKGGGYEGWKSLVLSNL